MKNQKVYAFAGVVVLSCALISGYLLWLAWFKDTSSTVENTGIGGTSVVEVTTPADQLQPRLHFRDRLTSDHKAVTAQMGDHPTVDNLITNPDDLRSRSAMVGATPFNIEAYQRDPSSYLNKVEPGRALAPAKAGPGVPVIIGINETTMHIIEKDGTVELKVRVPKGMPVSFHSADLGQFKENGLTSITVAADEEGIAKVTFHASYGVTQDCHIIAASPVASGQARFSVYVKRDTNDQP